MAAPNPIQEALQHRANNIALLNGGFLRLGSWFRGSTGQLHPLTEIPDSFDHRLCVTVNDPAAFPIILRYPSEGDWEETEEIRIEFLEIHISKDKVCDISEIVDPLNQLLSEINVGTVELILDDNSSLNGLEFVTGIKRLSVKFSGNFSLQALTSITLLPNLVSLRIYARQIPIFRDDDDCPHLILSDHLFLKSIHITRDCASPYEMRDNYENASQTKKLSVATENRNSKKFRIIIRNCPALNEISAADFEIDMDSLLPYIDVPFEKSLSEFPRVQPERFTAKVIYHVVAEELRRFHVKYLRIGHVFENFSIVNAPLGELSELTLEWDEMHDFEFLELAPNLTLLDIVAASRDSFTLWNNTLEPHRRFVIEEIDGRLVCRR